MAGLTIGWEYLTGYAVATDIASRERVEWPPHPARVFMAMAAAWFETEPGDGASDEERREHEAEGAALRWLESLDEPELWLPPSCSERNRTCVKTYVPVNDKAGPAKGVLQSAVGLTRGKQPRSFPRLFVGDAPVHLHWPEAEGLAEHLEALKRVCAKVTRIGHSSSLVWMWAAEGEPRAADAYGPDGAESGLERWVPSDGVGQWHARRVSPGLLDALPGQTNIPRIEAFADLVWKIKDAECEAERAKKSGNTGSKRAANTALREAKQEYEHTFNEKYKKKSVSPPPLLRPRIGLWTGYRQDRGAVEPDLSHSHFDTDLLVLTQTRGPRLALVSTLGVCSALRKAVMSACPDPIPEWVSGHKSDGSASERQDGHMAIFPLAFVGHEHADGHLLGMALAFPRAVGQQERGRVLRPLFVDRYGEIGEVDLRMGRLGRVSLRPAEWDEPRRALQARCWTAAPDGACVWASVTPVVLDRFPKADRHKARGEWELEVRNLIGDACDRIGLPCPVEIDIDTTSWNLGSPRSICKQRRLRGERAQTVCFGGGFPVFPAKGTNGGPRPQVHVWLRFASPVIGPVLIGAGRYRGYGLCRPLMGVGEFAR